MCIYGTIGICRKYIPLSSSVIAFARGLLGALFLCAFVKLRGRKIRHHMGRRNVIRLIISGALMGFNWILLFEAYNYTTVAVATLCYYMEPTILMLVSPFLFHEKLTRKKMGCAALAVVGMVFVSGVLESGGTNAVDFRGILLGLGAAALYSVVVIINNTVTLVDAYEKTILQLASAAAVMVPYILLTEDVTQIRLEPLTIGMLLLVGLVHTGAAYAMYFGSMDGLNVQTIALFSYIDPIVALLLSAAVLKEPMTVFGIFGAILIIGAAVFSEVDLFRIGRKRAK